MLPVPTPWRRLRLAWHAGLDAWRQSADAPPRPVVTPAATPAVAPEPAPGLAAGSATSTSLSTVLAHSPDGVVHLCADGRVAGLNERAQAFFGPALATGQPVRRLAAPGEWARWLRELRPVLQQRGVWVGEVRLRLQGQVRPFSVTLMAHQDPALPCTACSAVLRDLADQQAAHQQIQRQNQILGAIAEALPATVVIVDSQGRYRYVNSAFERYVGRGAADILGRTAGEVLGADEVARRRPFMKQAFAGEPVEFVLDYPGTDGPTWLALSCIPIRLDGVFDGFVGISQDITVQRREQERLAGLAETDPLTGLLNRAGLEQRVARQRLQLPDSQLALLYIDLDHFKAINDTLGHAAGDQLLIRFARRLMRSVRSSDVVARLGGDEFAILLPGVQDLGTAQLVAQQVLAAAGRSFELDGQVRTVGASIGLAVLPSAQAGLAELLRQADTQLYRAKAAGRGQFCSDGEHGSTHWGELSTDADDEPARTAPGPLSQPGELDTLPRAPARLSRRERVLLDPGG